jgi:hypothetical protein
MKKQNNEKIYECEVKRLHQKKDSQRYWDWIRRRVDLIERGDLIRCYECKGKVRLHKKKVPNGPQDHVEHSIREDSEGCSLGHYFMGTPKTSSEPIE